MNLKKKMYSVVVLLVSGSYLVASDPQTPDPNGIIRSCVSYCESTYKQDATSLANCKTNCLNCGKHCYGNHNPTNSCMASCCTYSEACCAGQNQHDGATAPKTCAVFSK